MTRAIANKKIDSKAIVFLRVAFLSLVLFLFFFEWNLFSFLTTRRAAIVISLLYLVLSRKTKMRIKSFFFFKHTKYSLFLLIPLLFNIIVNLELEKISTNDYFEPIHFVNLFLYIFVFSLFVIVYVDNPFDFCYAVVLIITIQSIFVYGSLTNYSFRMWLFRNFYNGDNRFDRFVENGSRIMGLALYSSLGSIAMLCGLISLLYLIRKRKINTFLFTFLYAFILIATAFIARTGFYFGIIILVPYLFTFKKGFFAKVFSVSLVGLVAMYLFFNYLSSKVDAGQWNYLLNWMGEIFNSDTRFKTINAVSESPIPPLTIETFFGTGILRGVTDSGIEIANDSGYVEMYASLGLINAILFYSCFILIFVSLIRSMQKDKVFFTILLVVMFVIEFKEPYIRKYTYTTFLLTLAFLNTYGFLQSKNSYISSRNHCFSNINLQQI